MRVKVREVKYSVIYAIVVLIRSNISVYCDLLFRACNILPKFQVVGALIRDSEIKITYLCLSGVCLLLFGDQRIEKKYILIRYFVYLKHYPLFVFIKISHWISCNSLKSGNTEMIIFFLYFSKRNRQKGFF